MPLLEVKGVSKVFGGLKAINNVNFIVNEGEIVSIIGPNGAGKTTIFNILTGIYEVSEGKIIFDGEEIQNKNPQYIINKGMSRTFQNIRLFSDMKIIENVLVGAHINTKYGFFDSIFRTKKFKNIEMEKEQLALKTLKELGLNNRYNDYATNLPYGDQRKLEIARAMVTGAKIILLDEPAAGMNPQESEELLCFINSLKKRGLTIILIEHDMSIVMNISDRIYIFDNGEKIAEGLPEEVRNDKRVIEAYLGGEF